MHGRHRGVPGELGFLHFGEELERAETLGAEHRAAARERRGEAGDQPVDMEQRHDVEGAVARGKLERGGDVSSRSPDVGLGQRHDLRARGGARGVQDEGDVMRFGGAGTGGGGAGTGGGAPGVAAEPEGACAALSLGHERDQADAKLLRRLKRRRCAAGFDDQRLGLEIAEVELEFVLAIGGI